MNKYEDSANLHMVYVLFIPKGFLMTHGSCFVHSQRFSRDRGFMFCSFPEVFSCHRVHVLFFPSGFLMSLGSCFVHTQRFSHETGFMFCSFPLFFS